MAQTLDGKEYLNLTKPRMTYSDHIDKSTYPEAEVRQKLATDKNWSVCKSYLDKENKQFVFDCAVNANDIARRTISFDEACKTLHWSKFELLNNDQTVKWHSDKTWESEVAAAAKRTADNPIVPVPTGLETTYRK